MSLAITHFAVGASGALLALAALRPAARYRLSIAVASGFWALLPDLGYVVPVLRPMPAGGWINDLGNVFWLHSQLDALVVGRGTRDNAALALALLLASAVIADVAEADARSDRDQSDRDRSDRDCSDRDRSDRDRSDRDRSDRAGSAPDRSARADSGGDRSDGTNSSRDRLDRERPALDRSDPAGSERGAPSQRPDERRP